MKISRVGSIELDKSSRKIANIMVLCFLLLIIVDVLFCRYQLDFFQSENRHVSSALQQEIEQWKGHRIVGASQMFTREESRWNTPNPNQQTPHSSYVQYVPYPIYPPIANERRVRFLIVIITT
jgi:hypothetical protein